MRRLFNFGRPYSPGRKGRIIVFVDQSPSMFGDPTKIVDQSLPEIRKTFPKLQVITFIKSSDIGPALESAVSIRPERSIVISDGYIGGDEKASRITGMIDAIFCGNEAELQALPRRISDPDYHSWKDYHPCMPKEHYAAGAYILWRMTRGRGVFNPFPPSTAGLIDLIVHRQRRIHHHHLPDLHIHHGAR